MTPADRDSYLLTHYQLTLDQQDSLARLARQRAEEREAKSNAWSDPRHSSLTSTERDRIATHAALNHTKLIFELEGEVAGRQLEVEHIRLALAYDPVQVS